MNSNFYSLTYRFDAQDSCSDSPNSPTILSRLDSWQKPSRFSSHQKSISVGLSSGDTPTIEEEKEQYPSQVVEDENLAANLPEITLTLSPFSHRSSEVETFPHFDSNDK